MITVTDIEKLATLARVEVGDAEKAQLVKEIDSILAYVDTIKKASVDTSSPEGRLGAVRNIARPDIAIATSEEDRERILAEAPDRVGSFVAVKKIL
jgi:aspartyl-tRNA(Asn)/glutamyl-tRNA(Gln) amidotransferase subunit C